MEESVFKSEDKKCIFEAICGCFILKKQDEKHISECSSFFLKLHGAKSVSLFFKKRGATLYSWRKITKTLGIVSLIRK